jgi:hypothetical protein
MAVMPPPCTKGKQTGSFACWPPPTTTTAHSNPTHPHTQPSGAPFSPGVILDHAKAVQVPLAMTVKFNVTVL